MPAAVLNSKINHGLSLFDEGLGHNDSKNMCDSDVHLNFWAESENNIFS